MTIPDTPTLTKAIEQVLADLAETSPEAPRLDLPVERAAIASAVAEKVAGFYDARLEELHFGRAGFSMEVTGHAVKAIALALVSHFKAIGALNYVEFNLFDGDGQRYTVTVQKVGAVSPGGRITELMAALAPFVTFAEQVEAKHPGWDHDAFSLFPSPPLGMAAFRHARKVVSALPVPTTITEPSNG